MPYYQWTLLASDLLECNAVTPRIRRLGGSSLFLHHGNNLFILIPRMKGRKTISPRSWRVSTKKARPWWRIESLAHWFVASSLCIASTGDGVQYRRSRSGGPSYITLTCDLWPRGWKVFNTLEEMVMTWWYPTYLKPIGLDLNRAAKGGSRVLWAQCK